jgi:hypothetical protein
MGGLRGFQAPPSSGGAVRPMASNARVAAACQAAPYAIRQSSPRRSSRCTRAPSPSASISPSSGSPQAAQRSAGGRAPWRACSAVLQRAPSEPPRPAPLHYRAIRAQINLGLYPSLDESRGSGQSALPHKPDFWKIRSPSRKNLNYIIKR